MISIIVVMIILFVLVRWVRSVIIKNEQKEQNRINYNIATVIIQNNFHMKRKDIDEFFRSELYKYFLIAHNNKLEINDELEKNLKYNVKIYMKNKRESS
ncbi:hypothetical protein NRK67_16885 (plasmid) [Fusobacteria bacterium ZRK30]|nr:hypothetical protein NRK67_16885 [Fusobacteria bacterium ZRK30]